MKRPARELLVELYARDVKVRAYAATELGARRGSRAVTQLLGLALQGHDADSVAAAEALVRIGEPAVMPLIWALRHRSHIRSSEILALFPADQVLDPLLSALGGENRQVRACSAVALGLLGDARAVEPLLETAARDPDKNVRLHALAALGRLGDPRAVRDDGPEYASSVES